MLEIKGGDPSMGLWAVEGESKVYQKMFDWVCDHCDASFKKYYWSQSEPANNVSCGW